MNSISSVFLGNAKCLGWLRKRTLKNWRKFLENELIWRNCWERNTFQWKMMSIIISVSMSTKTCSERWQHCQRRIHQLPCCSWLMICTRIFSEKIMEMKSIDSSLILWQQNMKIHWRNRWSWKIRLHIFRNSWRNSQQCSHWKCQNRRLMKWLLCQCFILIFLSLSILPIDSLFWIFIWF